MARSEAVKPEKSNPLWEHRFITPRVCRAWESLIGNKTDNTSTLLAYLILTDGGKVEFKTTQHSEWDPSSKTYYWYTFLAQAIYEGNQ